MESEPESEDDRASTLGDPESSRPPGPKSYRSAVWDPQPFAHGIVSDEDALIALIRNGLRIIVARGRRVRGLCGGGGETRLGTAVCVNKSCCVPCPPSGVEGIPRSRSYELGSQVVVIRIRYHREVPGPVDTGDKDRIDVVTVSSHTGKLYPRVVVFYCILLEGARSLNVFPEGLVVSYKGSASFSREPERDAATGFRHPSAHVELVEKTNLTERTYGTVDAGVRSDGMVGVARTLLVLRQPGPQDSGLMILSTSNSLKLRGT